jgi:hypothetical protein
MEKKEEQIEPPRRKTPQNFFDWAKKGNHEKLKEIDRTLASKWALLSAVTIK